MARVKHKRKATAAHSSPNRKRNATAKNSSDLTAATGQPSSLESLAYKNTPSKASPIPTYQTLDLVSDSEQEEVIGHNTRHRVLIDNKTPRPIIESVEQQSDVDSPRSNILQKQQKTRHDDASPVKSRVTTRSSSQRSIDTHPKSIPNSRPSMSSFDEQQQMGDGGYELDQVPGQLIAHSVQDQTDDLCVESTLDQESPAHEVMVEHAEDSDLKPEQLPTTHLSWDYKEDDIPAKYCSFNNSVRTPTKQHSHRIKSKVSHSNPRRDSDEPHSGSSSSKSIQYRNLASDDVTPLSRRSTSKAAEAFVMVTPVKANPSYQISVYPEIVNSIDLDSFNYLLAKLYDGRWLELHTPQGEVVDVNLLNDELPTYIATAKANAVEAFTHNVWRKHALLELSDMPHSIAKHLVVAQSLLNVDEVIMLRNQFNDKGHEFTFTQRHRHFTKLASKLVKLLKLLISPGFKLAEKRGDLFGLLMSYIHFQIFFSRMSAGPKADISSAEPRTLFKKYESFNILDEAFEIHPNELAEMSTSQIHNYEARMEKLKTMSAYALNKALLSESLAPFNLIEETLRSVILQVMRPIEKDAIPEFYEGPLRYLPAEPSSICCEKITESIKNAHVAFTDAVKDPLTCIESNLNISKKSRAVLRSPPIHQSNHRVKLGQLPSKSASKSPKRVSDSTKSPKRQIKPPSEQLNSEHHHIRFLPVTLYPPDVDVLEDESKLKKIRRQKMAWTAEESDALYKGMEKYQRQWRKILDEYPVLHSRTNVDLKDHCRSMLKKRIRNNEDPGVWGI